MKPPKKRMMIGSAKVAINALWCINSDLLMPVRKKRKALSEVVKSSAPMSVTEVAHEEIASVTHMIVANAKIAITRCWITVSPSMPKAVEGKFHKMAVTTTAKTNKENFLNLKTSLNVFLLCSDIFIYVFMVSNNAAKLSIFSIRQKKYQKSLRIS
jgi:hypothetical protein